MNGLHAAVLALVIAGATGCGGGEQQEEAGSTTTAVTTAITQRCSPGAHSFTLENGQAAEMRVTPGGEAARALVVVLHGAGGTPGRVPGFSLAPAFRSAVTA